MRCPHILSFPIVSELVHIICRLESGVMCNFRPSLAFCLKFAVALSHISARRVHVIEILGGAAVVAKAFVSTFDGDDDDDNPALAAADSDDDTPTPW